MTKVSARESTIESLLRDHELVVCAGTGGVGKTTTSAALAIAAARLGLRAVVVTIDPARRLADALGLENLADVPERIEGDWDGELWALMLDAKLLFDRLVTEHAADQEQSERILANRFYASISTSLRGTQEYMALEQIHALRASERFDVIIVDTPPTRNALDVIDAPRHLGRLLDHRVYRLLTGRSTALTRLVNQATRQLVRNVSRIVGASVIDDAITFFLAFDGMEDGFRHRSEEIRGLLESDAAAFVLIASPRADTFVEAESFAARLTEERIAIRVVIANRMQPSLGRRDPSLLLDQAREHDETAYAELLRNLADHRTLAIDETAALTGLEQHFGDASVVRVRELTEELDDFGALLKVADQLR